MYKSLFLSFLLLTTACSKEMLYPTNGETIYRTGKNKQGDKLLDKDLSKITLFKSCQSCHGRDGSRISNIQYKVLTDKKAYKTPYTPDLLNRFLDDDVKSDGSKARTGVKWRMSEQDKKDLVAF